MNVSRIEIYGTRGKIIKYLEEGSKIIFTVDDAEVTGTVTNVAFDGERLRADRAVGLNDIVDTGKFIVHNNLKYPTKIGFYGLRPR